MTRRGDVVQIRDDAGALIPVLIVRWSGRLGSSSILMDQNAKTYDCRHCSPWVEAVEGINGPVFANGDRAFEWAARLTDVLHSNRGQRAMANLRGEVTAVIRRGKRRDIPEERDPAGGHGHEASGDVPLKMIRSRDRGSEWSHQLERYVCRHEREVQQGEHTRTVEVVPLPEIDIPHLSWLQAHYPHYHEVYMAHRCGVESYRAIADRLGITESIARYRQSAAMAKLRKVSIGAAATTVPGEMVA